MGCEWHGKTEILGRPTCPSATSSIKNLVWTGLRSNTRLRGDRPTPKRHTVMAPPVKSQFEPFTPVLMSSPCRSSWTDVRVKVYGQVVLPRLPSYAACDEITCLSVVRPSVSAICPYAQTYIFWFLSGMSHIYKGFSFLQTPQDLRIAFVAPGLVKQIMFVRSLASAAVYLNSSVCWVITQRRLSKRRRFGTTYRSHLNPWRWDRDVAL